MASTVLSNGSNPSPEKLAQFDSAIAYVLALWPALTLAVNEQWGSSTSNATGEEKRALFAGAISDLFVQRPQTDEQDLEEVLLQVMEDEFEAMIDDGSEEEIAGVICRVRKECERGEFEGVRKLEGLWRDKRGMKVRGVQARQGGQDELGDSEEDESEEDDDDGDIEMGEDEAPQLVEARTKVEPEIDEEGFTKVIGRRRK